MNAKLCCIFFMCVLIASCRTTAGVPSNELGAFETQRALDELADKQTDMGITGQRIEDQSRDLVGDIRELEQSIESGAASNLEFEEIICRIYNRPVKDIDCERKSD